MQITKFFLPAVTAAILISTFGYAERDTSFNFRSSGCSSSSSSSSSSESESSHKSHKPICTPKYNNLLDPLIGSYGTKSCGNIDFGVISFQAGGTVVAQDSFSIGQANPPIFCHGSESTVGVGYWKKIRNHKYKFFFTKVVSTLGHNDPFPTSPRFRVRIEGDLTLCRENKSFKVCAKLTRWKLKDLACNSAPFSNSHHNIGHGPDHIAFKGHRLDFLE